MSRRSKQSLLSWLFLSPLIVIILFPFAVMFFTSVTPTDEVYAFPPSWLPTRFAWENYSIMWAEIGFGRALLNSIYVTVLATIVVLLVAVPAAYSLARYQFRGQGAYQFFLIITQMLSPILLMVGLFKFAVWLGLVDNLNALVLIYSGFGIAFAVWMLQNFFRTIPIDLEETAWLEGASWFYSLTRVFLPLATPAISVAAVFTFIFAWNEYSTALVILRSPENITLQLKVASLVGVYTPKWEQIMAAIFLSSVPVAIAFSWFQKHLVTGLAAGAVK
jgi:multiple sugar transport system permease protein